MLDRLFEIVENKRYDHAEFTIGDVSSTIFEDYCIRIYTKDGAYIRIINDWFVEGGIFKGYRVDRFYVAFFIPNEDTAIETYSVRDDQDKIMYEKLNKLFNEVRQNIKDDAMNKYF